MTAAPKPLPEPLTDDELEAALSAQIESATGFFGDQLSTRRAELFSVYLRHGYTDDDIARREDRSDIVDSTSADSVDAILGELLEMLMGAETIASFTANGPDDEAAARQETETIHNIFFTQNNGYLILQNWLWDGLALINGYVKAWRDERIVVETEMYSGQTEESMAAIVADLEADGAEIEVLFQEDEQSSVTVSVEELAASNNLQLEAEEADEVIEDPQTGEVTLITTTSSYRLKIKRKHGTYRIMPVATDEILVSARWDNVDLQRCPFVGHRYLETESNLIARGFDEEQVRALPTSQDEEFGDERTTRFDGYDLFEADDRASVDQSSRYILVTECWARLDRDGDGLSELIMAVMAGDELLHYEGGAVAVEEAEEVPIHAWTPFLIPHRHYGESIIERNAPIQRTMTIFQRMLSDGAVFSGNPRLILGRDGIAANTIDDAQIYRPGAVIRARDAAQVVPIKLDSNLDDVMPILDYWADRNEERTGATRMNQGIVADKFGKQVAGITIAQLRQAGMAKINMIARNFLETGFASLMRHIHALLRRHQDKELAFQVRGEWIQVDPRNWGPRSEVQVGIGLGTEGRMVKSEILREVIQQQATALEAGLVLADEQKLYNALTDFAMANGLRNPERYFNNPEQMPPQQEEEEMTPEQTISLAQIEVSRIEAETRLKGVVQKEIEDARQAQLKDRELDIKTKTLALQDDRERDIAALKAAVDLQKEEIAALRQQIQPPGGGSNGSGAAAS